MPVETGIHPGSCDWIPAFAGMTNMTLRRGMTNRNSPGISFFFNLLIYNYPTSNSIQIRNSASILYKRAASLTLMQKRDYIYCYKHSFHKHVASLTLMKKDYQPDRYEYKFYQTENTYKYRTYKVVTQKEEELGLLKNPFALVILSAKKIILLERDLGQKSTLKFSIMKSMLQSGYSRGKIIHMLEFIERSLQLPKELDDEIENKLRNDKEIGIMAEEYVMGSFTRRHYEKGLIEGEQKGKIEGEAEKAKKIALNMLLKNMPDDMIMELTGIEKSELSRLKKRRAN
jgi:hypothetical protein